MPTEAAQTTASADLHHKARQIVTLARDALDCATPGPRIDMDRARRKLATIAALAADAAGDVLP
jgi:hypothetical protein